MVEAASVQQQTVQSSSKSHSLFLIEIPKMVENWTSRCLQQDKSKQKSAIDCWRNAAVALEAYTLRINGPLLDRVNRIRLAWLERVGQLQFLSKRDDDAYFRAAEDTESKARFWGRQSRIVDRPKWRDERQSEGSQLSAKSQSLDNQAQRTATNEIFEENGGAQENESKTAVSFENKTQDGDGQRVSVPRKKPQDSRLVKNHASEKKGETKQAQKKLAASEQKPEAKSGAVAIEAPNAELVYSMSAVKDGRSGDTQTNLLKRKRLEDPTSVASQTPEKKKSEVEADRKNVTVSSEQPKTKSSLEKPRAGVKKVAVAEKQQSDDRPALKRKKSRDSIQETSNTAQTKKAKKIVVASKQKPDRPTKPRQLNIQPAASADENARVAAANEAALEVDDEQVPTSTKGMRASEARDLCRKRFGPVSQIRHHRGEWYCTQP